MDRSLRTMAAWFYRVSWWGNATRGLLIINDEPRFSAIRIAIRQGIPIAIIFLRKVPVLGRVLPDPMNAVFFGAFSPVLPGR